MAARPLYLGTDVLQRARDLEFRQRADRDIWKLGFDHQAESDITGLSKLIEPPPLELQAAPEQEPLPIVVSDRPDALALQRQAQERQAPQQSMMQPAQQQQAPPPASGAPVAMPVASDPEGQRMPTSERAANLPQSGGEYRAYARQVAQAYGLDPDIFERQINQESGFQQWGPDGRPLGSSAGAQGIAQFMPGTAASYGVDVNDPYSSLEGAARHMRDLLRANNGNYRLALAAYNAGQGNVDKYGEGVFGDDFANGETKRYVQNILGGGAPVMPRLSLNAAPSSAPGGAAPPAPAGVSSAPAGAPPAPWEMAGANLREGTQTDANSLMLKENDGEDVGSFPTSARQIGNTGADSNLLPGDGGTPPTPEYDSRQYDEGPREYRPPAPTYADPTVSDPAYSAPRQPDPIMGPEQPAEPPSGPLKPLYDTAGRVIGYVQDAVRSVVAPNDEEIAAEQERQRQRQAERARIAGPRWSNDGGASLEGADLAPFPYGPAVPGDINQTARDRFPGLVTDAPLVPDTIPGQRPVSGAVPPPRAPLVRRQDNAEEAAAEIERNLPDNPLARAVSQAGRAQFFNEPASRQAIDIFNAIQELPFETYATLRRQLISDAEAKALAGTDPLAPFRGLGIDLPSVADLNPEGRPASDVLIGLVLQGALPDPADPLVQAGFHAIGAGARGTAWAVRTAPRLARAAGRESAETLTRWGGAANRGLQGVGREVAGGLMDLNPAMTPRVVGDGGPGIGRALAEAGEAVPERPVYSPEPPAGVQRRYHGTAGAFERPDPSRFDENGLYGPGYYTTSDPRVAGSYADNRGQLQNPDTLREMLASSQRYIAELRAKLPQMDPDGRLAKSMQQEIARLEAAIPDWERQLAQAEANPSGPYIRAIDVPNDVRLLDVDAPLDPALLDEVDAVIDTLARQSPDVAERLREATAIIRDRLANGGVARTNDAVVQELFNAAERIPGMGKGLATEVLQRAGFDGIAHKGGQRVPIFDSAGRPIEHDVTVIFPDRLDRVRNAFSGEKGGAFLPMDPASAAVGAGAGVDEDGEVDPWRTGAGVLFAGVAGSRAKPSGGISKLGRRVMETYARVTPERVAASTTRTLQIASDAIAGKIPSRGGLSVSPSELVRATHEAIVRNLRDTKEVMTGLRPGALAAYMRGEGLTSKVDTGDLEQIRRITQQQVNVEGGRAQIVDGKKMKVPYTLEEAGHFAARESEQMRVATGGTRFPDPETGAIDEAAPRVMYAYVNEGQPLVGPNRPTLWLAWNDETPRITSANHPFGLTSPGQSIHDSMPPGVKAAIWAEDAIKGGRPIPGPGGAPIVAGWERAGVRVAPGRKIADTNWLVGPDGEDAMRANGLLLAMPQKIQQQIAKGQLTDPEQIAAVLMRGGAPQWKPGWAAVQNTSRSESLILDPDIANIKAIYLTATPSNLAATVPNTGSGRGKNATKALTELQMAQKIRADVQAATGRDIPIYLTDISQPGRPTSMADAKLLEGTPLERPLSPGRSRIVDQYTQATDPATGAPYTNLGSRMPFDPASAAMGGAAGAMSEGEDGEQGDPWRTLGGMAVAGILGNVSPRAARRWRQATTRANMQAAAARAAGKAPPATAADWLRSIGYSGMIGPSTGIVNAVGNGMELLYHLPKDMARSLARGAPRESWEEAKGLLTGLTRAGGEMLDALAGAHPGGGVENARLSQRVQNPIGQVLANLIEAPTRVFSEVPDAFYRSIATSMGESRRAAQIATDEGLKGAAWSQRVNQLLADVAAHRNGGAASPQVVSIIKDGVQLSERLTLRGPKGTAGQAFSNLRNALPFGLGHLVWPFFDTPYQMLQRGLERSPAGLRMGTQPAKFDKYYDAIVGSGIGLGAVGLATGGLVTGSGPDDPEKRKMLQSQGWQGNSTLVGGVWVPNNAFGVFGPLLDAAGEIGDGLRYQKKEAEGRDLGLDLLRRSAMVAKNQVYLRGLADLINAAGEQGSRPEAFAANLLSRSIPLGATARVAGNMTDPLERAVDQADDVGSVEAIRQRVARGLPGQGLPIVGGREGLQPAQDVLGRPQENERSGLAALGPKTRTPKPDATIQAFTEAGVDIGNPPDAITIDGISLELTPAEQRRWQRERGAILEKYAGTFKDKPWWNKPASREVAMKELLREANAAANGKVQQFIGADALRRRLRESAQQKKAS